MARGFFSKAYWILAGLGGLWAVAIGLFLHPDLQRFALYANKVHTAYWENLNRSELWGFLPGQVRPFHVTTLDDISLYAWHILPLGIYRKHEKALYPVPETLTQSEPMALDYLKNDPNAKVVIKFHGNAGHVAQGWRPDTYRALTGAAPDSIHVIGFDYRGFGYSTGSPTEQGVIQDGIAMVNWVLKEAGIPPGRIVLFGQSLGTAVSTAVAEHFLLEENIEFAGLVLIASFSSIPELLPQYTLGGFVPTLSPLKMYPTILRWVLGKIVDTWNTSSRLLTLVRKSKTFNLVMIHAKNDGEIPWGQSQRLFDESTIAAKELGTNSPIKRDTKLHKDIAGGGWIETWSVKDHSDFSRNVKLIISPSGGHNQIMTYPVAVKAVLDCFDAVLDTEK